MSEAVGRRGGLPQKNTCLRAMGSKLACSSCAGGRKDSSSRVTRSKGILNRGIGTPNWWTGIPTLGLGVLLALGSRTSSAFGQDDSSGSPLLSWINSSGGSASTPSNWSPVRVPTADDDLRFNINGTYTVTFNSSVPASHAHSYEDGNVTLSLTSPHSAIGIDVGGDLLDFASMTLTTGRLSTSTVNNIAFGINTAGTLNVNDDDADLIGANNLIVGTNGLGIVNVTGGGFIEVPTLLSGMNTQGRASVDVTGFSSVPAVSSQLVIHGTGYSVLGDRGDATLNITNGGRVQVSGPLAVARRSGSASSVTVSGTGITDATLQLVNDLEIGFNRDAGVAAGTATVDVNVGGVILGGGRIRIGGDPDGGSGALHIEGDGVVSADSVFVGLNGSLDMEGGLLGANSTFHRIAAGGSLSGFGDIDGDLVNLGQITATGTGLDFFGNVVGTGQGMGGVLMRFIQGGAFTGSGVLGAAILGDASSSFTATNHLTLGDPGSSAGVDLDGDLTVSNRIVTLRDFDRAALSGAVTLAGGTLLAPNGVLLESGGTLSGAGTIDADFLGQASSSIVAGGVLTIGDVADPNGFHTDGSIDVGPHTVSLLDQDGARASSVRLVGGTLISNSPLFLPDLPAVLSGFGEIATPDLLLEATLDPGFPIGTIRVSGDYRTNASGSYIVEIGPTATAANASDRLEVSGRALLHGGVLVLGLPGLQLAPGDSFAIVTASQIDETFREITFGDPELQERLEVIYTPTAVSLVVRETSAVGSPVGAHVPDRLALRLAGSNPFRAASGTAFELDLPSDQRVAVTLFDARGRRITDLVNGSRSAGTHRVEWPASLSSGLASGSYFVRMQTGAFETTCRVVLIK